MCLSDNSRDRGINALNTVCSEPIPVKSVNTPVTCSTVALEVFFQTVCTIKIHFLLNYLLGQLVPTVDGLITHECTRVTRYATVDIVPTCVL